MRRVFITQRVDVSESHGERRDALDQRWAPFLLETTAIAVPVPNHRSSVAALIERLPPDGIVLTGGNSPVGHGGDAPERDEVDALLTAHARDRAIPLIGVCRGMQSIALFFGGTLKPVAGHVATRHALHGNMVRSVNSYHNLAIDLLPPCLEVLARSEDGVIEMIRHTFLPIVACMWHPEREPAFVPEDIALFANLWSSAERIS